MTASALNSASMTTSAARAPDARAPNAAGATAGFDALMAALFAPGQLPQDPGAQASTVAAPTAALAPSTDTRLETGAAGPEDADSPADDLVSGEATAPDLRLVDTVPIPPTSPPAPPTAADTGLDATARAPGPSAAATAWPTDTLAAPAGEVMATDDSDTPAATPDLTQDASARDTAPDVRTGTAAAAPAGSQAALRGAAAAAPTAPAQTAPVGDGLPPVTTPTTPATGLSTAAPDAASPNAPPLAASQAAAQATSRSEPATAPRAARADRRAATDEASPAPATREGMKAAAEKAAKSDALTAATMAAADATASDGAGQDAGPFLEPSETAPAVASRAAAHTEATPSTAPAPAPVRGSPETVANLAAQIARKLEGRSTRFDVELNPEGLGKVDVRVEIGAHGRLTAALAFDNPQAAQDLKARAADLQRALEQAGFDVAGGLSFDVAQDQGGGRQAWQDARSELGENFRGQAFRAALETAGDAADIATQGALRLRQGVNAGLDLRI